MQDGAGDGSDGVGRRGGGNEWGLGLRTAPSGHEILILSDSQAAISAVRSAGRAGMARALVVKIRERKSRLRSDAVRFDCVKAHVDSRGNEYVDQEAKEGAAPSRL